MTLSPRSDALRFFISNVLRFDVRCPDDESAYALTDLLGRTGHWLPSPRCRCATPIIIESGSTDSLRITCYSIRTFPNTAARPKKNAAPQQGYCGGSVSSASLCYLMLGLGTASGASAPKSSERIWYSLGSAGEPGCRKRPTIGWLQALSSSIQSAGEFLTGHGR